MGLCLGVQGGRAPERRGCFLSASGVWGLGEKDWQMAGSRGSHGMGLLGSVGGETVGLMREQKAG